jgi:hypothetical protein
MKTTDVTKQVRFESNDDELLPITQCICGAKLQPHNGMRNSQSTHLTVEHTNQLLARRWLRNRQGEPREKNTKMSNL